VTADSISHQYSFLLVANCYGDNFEVLHLSGTSLCREYAGMEFENQIAFKLPAAAEFLAESATPQRTPRHPSPTVPRTVWIRHNRESSWEGWAWAVLAASSLATLAVCL